MPKARKSSLRVKHNKLGPLSSPLKPSSTSPSKLVEAAIPLDDKDVQQEDSPSLLSLSSTPWSDSMANEHLTIDEKRALSILHQLCAFEQVLMEFFTGLDGLDISPVKGSLVLSYDRVELFVNPQTGRQARRADDIKELEGMIKAITKSQIDAKDNVVPRSYLLRIQDNFLSALRNPFVHLRESAQVPGQVGLFVRPKDNASGKKKSRPPNLEGIRFELFSFPRKIVSPEDHGFLDDLSFDYTHRRVGERESKKYILIGLGMARVINHHCTRDKVEWPFAPNGLKFKDGHKEIGVMSSELVLKRGKSLVAGSEVFGYYGDEFARLDCKCDSPTFHDPDSSPSSTPPKPQKRQNPYIDLESASRADSMDLDSIRMEGSSRVHVHQSPLGPFDRFIQARNLDRDTDDAAPKGISGRKKKRRKSRKHDSSQDHDDHPVAAGDDNDIQYLSDGIGIAAGHLRSTTPKRRKKGSISKAGVIEIDQDQDALEVVSLFSSLRASVVPDDGADNVLVPESSGNAAEEPTPSPSPPSTSDIMNRMMQLDERIEDQLDILQDREQQFDKLIADLIDLKEVVQRDAKVLAQLRRQQKGLIKGITEILTKTGKATLEESRPAGGRSHQSVSVCSSTFMDFLAMLDVLDITPVNGSQVMHFDRKELFIIPGTTRFAKRDDTMEHLEAVIESITQSQINAEDNLIPPSYLYRIRNNFLSALRNPFLRLGKSKTVQDRVGLFLEKPNYTSTGIENLQQRGQMSDVQGVKFELFSLPRSFTNPERYGFLDDLIFEYTHRRVRSRKSHKYLLIGLGTARLINHRCRDHAISWEFATNALRFKKYAKEIGIMTTEVVVHKHDEKKLVFGKELFAYYGDEYARLACKCEYPTLHSAFISVDSPDLPEFRLPQIENPAWSSDSRRESRENSMDLGNYQMEGASAKQPQEYLNTDSDYEADEQKCLKWARTKSSRGRKRNLAQSPDHESQLEVDVGSDHDDHVDYLKTRHSAGNRVDISKRQKRIVSPEVQDIYTLEHDTVFPSMLPSTFTHIQEDGITIQGPDTQPGISIPTTSNTELIDRMIEMQEKMGNYLRNVKDREEQCTRILSDLLDMREHLREDKQQLYQLQEEHMRLINDMKTTDKARDKAHRETTTLAVEDTDRSETGEDDGLDDSLEDTTLRDQASAYTGHLMCSQQ